MRLSWEVKRKYINSTFTGKILFYAIPDFKHYLQCKCWRYL